MPFLRREPRVSAKGKATLRLSPSQRDWLLRCHELPPALVHLLRRASVREGWLALRVSRDELERLIVAGARQEAPDRAAENELIALAKYLEATADRFEDEDETSS
jgi:hypothetical protein